MDDLISRAAAIERAITAVDDWDGGWNPNRETVIRKYFEELPAVDAVPVEWLRGLMIEYANINTPEHAAYAYCLNNVIEEWHKEQEAR